VSIWRVSVAGIRVLLSTALSHRCISATLEYRPPSAADGSGEVHIDLAGVDYCGLAGLRVLTGLGDGDGQEQLPRRLILHHLPAHLSEVLRILGWDTAPGLAIASTSASPAAAD